MASSDTKIEIILQADEVAILLKALAGGFRHAIEPEALRALAPHLESCTKLELSIKQLGGMAELYYKDASGKLNLYMLARSYYGGLRATLRVATDPETERDERRRAVLVAHEDGIYYRWSLIESQDDMTDVMFFFMSTYSPAAKFDHSCRYGKIFVKEIDSGGLVTI